MRIDIHAHGFPASYLERMERTDGGGVHAVRGVHADDGPGELRTRLDLMDGAGIDIQVVSASSVVPAFDEAAPSLAAAQVGNDAYAELVARHPDRLRAFAVLPLPHVDAALEEIDRALALPGIVGVAVTTTVAGRSIADESFEPVFAELARRSAVLFVHPAGRDAGSPLIGELGLSWMIGAPIEDTLAATHLIVRGVPTRHPRLRVVIAHLGGALPLLVRRLGALLPRVAPEATESAGETARRMWYDTVAHGHAPALAAAAASFGSDRLVLGSDYPYVRGAAYGEAVTYVEGADLDRDGIDAVLGGTAAALLGLD